MTRWILPAALAIIASGTVAYLASPRTAEPIPERIDPAPAAPIEVKPVGPRPRVSVEGDMTFRFGMKPQHASFTKEWIVNNRGEGDLVLEPEPPPCGTCKTTNFPHLPEQFKNGRLVIPPGGQTPIAFSWDTQQFNGRCRWPMALVTNDVESPKLVFLAEGVVRPPVALDPQSGINLLDVFDDEESHHGEITVYSPDRPDLKLIKLTSSKPDLLEIKPKALSIDECRSLGVKSGYRLDVILKRGLPPGPFLEEVMIATDHPGQSEVKFALMGKIVRPIAVMPERLRLLGISRSRGGEGSVTLVARGRRKTEFRVERKPEMVEVEIVPADRTAGAGIYRLKAVVAPNCPRNLITDTIILKTDHPFEPELPIPIEVVIRDEG